MYDCEYNMIVLNDAENEKLKEIAGQFLYNPAEEPDLFCQEAKELSKLLPQNIKQQLHNFAKNGNKNCFLLLKNEDGISYPVNYFAYY